MSGGSPRVCLPRLCARRSKKGQSPVTPKLLMALFVTVVWLALHCFEAGKELSHTKPIRQSLNVPLE